MVLLFNYVFNVIIIAIIFFVIFDRLNAPCISLDHAFLFLDPLTDAYRNKHKWTRPGKYLLAIWLYLSII